MQDDFQIHFTMMEYLVISSLYSVSPLQTKLAVRFLILGSQGTTQLKSVVMFW